MADFDARAEKSEREGDARDGQACRAEAARKTQAVQEAEGKSHEPGFALSQSVWIFLLRRIS